MLVYKKKWGFDAIELYQIGCAPMRRDLAAESVLLKQWGAGAKVGILMLQHYITQLVDGNDFLDIFQHRFKIKWRTGIDQNGFVVVDNKVGVAIQLGFKLQIARADPIHAFGDFNRNIIGW